MSRPDSALLFAAGLGLRMRPLTDTVPKPLVEVAGRPLFDHALDLLRRAGIGTIVANTHYLADRMAAHLARNGVAESREPELLDTGGGLKAALPLLRPGPAITLNTDAVWTGTNPVETLCHAWDPGVMDGLMVMVPRDAAAGHGGNGDFSMDAKGRLKPGTDLVYTGLQILKTGPFRDEIETFFSMHRVWGQMLADSTLHGVIHGGGWCDVGRPESIALAEAMLEGARV
ncbi:nucleotidyltransferase family protein [Psychromarinibacter sp. C21-152]|uniref:Nucleotidyltransferase family protein n=1 Tax=Psychromarinibacter sediminicola TaxID=3033385 RepID=A0AAE3TA66_9RHOB|nr:nucleotidyltransferase family protein [Psychromarinibacter sediminicola]MDF0601300.1 nucleotidyltransferase family protein [Psychromarinibacter sediminicola]